MNSGIWILLGIFLLCTACEQRDMTMELQQQLEQIRQQSGKQSSVSEQRATVAPQFQYDAQHLNSPMLAPSLAMEIVANAYSVQPDFQRSKQYLEHFALNELLMKGTFQGNKGIQAIIMTPDHRLELVKVGSYIGKNHGKIVAIYPNYIDIVEIVPNGKHRYVERRRKLVLLQANQVLGSLSIS